MKVTGRLLGVKAMQRKLAMVNARMVTTASRALAAEANIVMREAKRITPRSPGSGGGTLRASGKVDQVERITRGLAVRLSFGDDGPSSFYALAVHETPSPHDPPSWIGKHVNFHTAGTGPQYLATPLRAATAAMDSRIAARMRL